MWCSGGGAGGDSLCKGGGCNSCRSGFSECVIRGVGGVVGTVVVWVIVVVAVLVVLLMVVVAVVVVVA